MKAVPLLLAEAFPFSLCASEMKFHLSCAYRKRGGGRYLRELTLEIGDFDLIFLLKRRLPLFLLHNLFYLLYRCLLFLNVYQKFLRELGCFSLNGFFGFLPFFPSYSGNKDEGSLIAASGISVYTL